MSARAGAIVRGAPALVLVASLASGCASARPLRRVERCRLEHGPRAAVVVGPSLQVSVVPVPGDDRGLCARVERVENENAVLRARVGRLEREAAARAAASVEIAPSPY